MTKTLSTKFSMRKFILSCIILILTILVWNLPSTVFGIEELTQVQQRIIAIFVFATLSWLTEAIPAWATSLGIITTMCLTVSTHAFNCFRTPSPSLGDLLPSKAVMGSFADPVIMLFLGGFIIAIACAKSGLDVYVAQKLLLPFGKKSERVLLGFLLITGLFSMFVSNTATAAMMLTFLMPIFASLPEKGKGRLALTMAIPIAANIGGMATPIGTPPNAIVLKFLNDESGLNMGVGFGEWMALMLPLTLILLFIAWRILIRIFPFSAKEVNLKMEGNVTWTWRTVVVAATTLLTILLWVLPMSWTGLDANTVAMVPIGVFAVTGVITASDLQDINWSVIWMVAGGFALGLGMNGTGLADAAIRSIPFAEWSPIAIMLISGLMCYLLSNFISNTATAALLAPILAMVCSGMGDRLDSVGGTATILIGIAIAASSAMCLPISTPPNAIAFSSGLIKQKDMLRMGIIIGTIALLLGYSMLLILK